ncbi:hypothetical protein N5D48_04645 [Pseudomonas sp. GD03858]|uniref:hypothetical protein n=1 Tax=unclassified Pseudomonas TaxID=196821 RepID=UPI00244763DB|nr:MULTISPECIES: hypothetical protein [unclassified Pseudomonas]MDH0648645.1 hypothetical protein [Pseudomonas sp. GD03867]MDH0661680.1 hypothetical protein [Pseudomonas sp. GD03858]
MTSLERFSKKSAYESDLNKIKEQVRKYNESLRSKAVGISSQASDPTLDEFGLPNVLPPAADGKENLFPLSARADGLYLTIPIWEDTDGVAGSFDIVRLWVNGAPVNNGVKEYNGESFPYTNIFDYPTQESALPGAFVIPYESLRVGGDGLKVIHYTVLNTDTGNNNSSPQQIVTLDIVDPAEGANPDALKFSDESKNGNFDLIYLQDNDGFEILLPSSVDYFPGDTYAVYLVGEANPLITGDVPPEGEYDSYPVKIDLATIQSRLPNGARGKLVYRLTDRAGNRTDSSIEVDVAISLVPAPDNLQAPLMTSPVDIDARTRGVEAVVPPNTSLRNGDTITMTLHTTPTPVSRSFTWPLDRTSFSGDDFGAIGTPRYDVILSYQVEREGALPVPSPETTVVVDLSLLIPDPTLLTPAQAVGRPSGEVGFIRPGDTQAFIVFTPFAGAAAGNLVRFFYGERENTFDYIISGTEPGPTIEVRIPDEMLTSAGNGTIPIGYQVRESSTRGNFQPAPDGSVEVSLFVVGISTLANFTGRVGGLTQEPGQGAALGRLNCELPEPLPGGVSLQIREPVGILKLGDDITITLTLSRGDFGIDPLTTNTEQIKITVDATQERTGVVTPVKTLLPRAFFEDPDRPGVYITRGSILAQWNIKRATGNLEEDSRESAVRFVLTRNGGLNCLPAV